MKFIAKVDNVVVATGDTASEAYDKAISAGYSPDKIVVSTAREAGEYRGW